MGDDNNMNEHKHIHLVLPDDLVDRVADYRFDARIASKNETYRILLEYALKHRKPKQEEDKTNG